MTETFGQIKKLNARKYWANESLDFTPWLAKEENITKLGDELGLELEVENIEVAVGPYSADILAKDSGSGNYVVIENQLEKTDHDHLGKAITYGSVLDASVIIWIATEFTEEHQKALEWLNEHASEKLSFYGVELVILQINDSLPAVQFNVISRPAEIVRQAAIAKAIENTSESQKLQFEFWSTFRQYLLDRKVLPSVQSARPQYWFDIVLGRSGIHLSNTASPSKKKIAVRVYLNNRIADIALKQLLDYKDDIEKEIGEKLIWNPNPDNRDKIICLYLDADIRNKEKWPEYIEWLTDRTLKFRKAFMPRVKNLDFTPSYSDLLKDSEDIYDNTQDTK